MSAAETVLLKLLEKIFKSNKNGEIQLTALNSGGANYTSALYSATVPSNGTKPLKLFAKVANVNGKLRELMNVRCMFETEQLVYSELAKIYDDIQEKHSIAPEYRFIFPKFYGGDPTEGEETVVLEDLTESGYSLYSRFKAIDWEHIAIAVEHLARFHALSFAFAKEDPDKFAEVVEKVKYKLPKNGDDPERKETWIKMVTAAAQVAKDEHKEKIAGFLLREIPQEELFKFKFPLSTPVLCHGDYRISNLMYKRENGVLKTIVVDYQTLHPACPAFDLLYLEFMGTDEQFRAKNHERLLDHYFSELTSALERLGVDVNDVYSRETFDKELKEMLPVALRSASFILPLVLVEAKNAPKLASSNGLEDFALSPTQLFAERYSGLISDCVKWGAI
ncbi:uncharacterized protein LOC142980017 [Anticarsia gemmatalis]|uniref:uncharacterized protein LOC142980017 n=1 Tax=Anticarsia gemmatalis TaxID=129554 RepID=UPI003F776B8F